MCRSRQKYIFLPIFGFATDKYEVFLFNFHPLFFQFSKKINILPSLNQWMISFTIFSPKPSISSSFSILYCAAFVKQAGTNRAVGNKDLCSYSAIYFNKISAEALFPHLHADAKRKSSLDNGTFLTFAMAAVRFSERLSLNNGRLKKSSFVRVKRSAGSSTSPVSNN